MNAQFFAGVHVMKCQCGSNTFRHHLTYRQINATDTVVEGVTDACAECGIAYVRQYWSAPPAPKAKEPVPEKKEKANVVAIGRQEAS